MNSYEQKKARRIERLERCAKLYEQQSQQAYSEAKKMSDFIPFGQPILVGHHSEKRHRNYIARIQRRHQKSWELSDKAKYYARRAASARSSSAISSDDPEAAFKLEERILELQNSQQLMKDVNAIIRKFDLNDLGQRAACLTAIMQAGKFESEGTAAKLLTPDFLGQIGFASYALQNNNANIRRLKLRLKQLTQLKAKEISSRKYDGLEVVENVEVNRVQLFFPGKPSEDIRKQLKGRGFRWSPLNGCWQAYINYSSKYFLESFVKQFQPDGQP